MTVFFTLRHDSVFYVLHVDGIGEYAMRNEDGIRCLFLFTSRDTITRFVELIELPEHKNYTAVEFDLPKIIGFLQDIRSHTPAIAIDPVANCEFTPVAIKDFLHALGLKQ